jgi:hypothetical protein
MEIEENFFDNKEQEEKDSQSMVDESDEDRNNDE